jgi:hypothetical protein
MTYCPNCGSGNIYLKRQTTFGYGAVGSRNGFVAAGGTDENYQNACMNCGHTWDAKELFNTLRLASGIVEQEIDLRYPKHRLFIQEISQELSNYLYLEGKLKSEVSSKIITSQLNYQHSCWIPIVLGIMVGAASSAVWGWTVGIIGVIIFASFDDNTNFHKKQKEKEMQEEGDRKKEKLRYDFGQNLHRIGTKYGLIRYELPPYPTQTFHRDWINEDFGI